MKKLSTPALSALGCLLGLGVSLLLDAYRDRVDHLERVIDEHEERAELAAVLVDELIDERDALAALLDERTAPPQVDEGGPDLPVFGEAAAVLQLRPEPCPCTQRRARPGGPCRCAEQRAARQAAARLSLDPQPAEQPAEIPATAEQPDVPALQDVTEQ